jgi:drug/metabolite transporter (DMT)-like permease
MSVMSEALLLLLIVTAGTSGELCVARAMRHAGEITDFRPAAVLRALGRALRLGWLWLGFALLVAYFVCLLAMLSIENVSFVVPMTALGYVVGALGGKFFLGERVEAGRWIGVLLVCAGTALVVAGRR